MDSPHLHKPCDMCGKTMDKRVFSYRNAPKHGFCSACYKKLPKVACTSCNERYRTVHQDNFVCNSCKIKERDCEYCGKRAGTQARIIKGKVACAACSNRLLEKRPCVVCRKTFKGTADWPEGKPVCKSCRQKLKRVRECVNCGRTSLFTKSDPKAGIFEPICYHCRTYARVTCADCHKHRKPVALNKEGKQICQRCHERGSKPFICPQCGCEGVRHSKSKCEVCYWRDYTINRVVRCQTLLNHEWSKGLFADFIQDLSAMKTAQYVASKVERHFPFFAKLDALFEDQKDINAEALLQSFTADGLRRFSAPYDFLAKTDVVKPLSRIQIEKDQEHRAHTKLIARSSGYWYEKEVKSYYDHLQMLAKRYKDKGWEEKSKYKPRTITALLRAAVLFYEFIDSCNIKAVSQIHQQLVDEFIVEHKGYKNSLRGLLNYMKRHRRLFRDIKIENVTSSIPENTFLPLRQSVELLREWLNAEGDDTKHALIGVLMLMYAQTPTKVARLKISDVFYGANSNYKIAFGTVPIEFDPRVSALFSRYLEVRGQYLAEKGNRDNEWLFPGRKFDCHMTTVGITDKFRTQGLIANQLFATALFNAYQTGMKQPKVLVNAFGIQTKTAIKYLQMFDPRMFDEAASFKGKQFA